MRSKTTTLSSCLTALQYIVQLLVPLPLYAVSSFFSSQCFSQPLCSRGNHWPQGTSGCWTQTPLHSQRSTLRNTEAKRHSPDVDVARAAKVCLATRSCDSHKKIDLYELLGDRSFVTTVSIWTKKWSSSLLDKLKKYAVLTHESPWD